MGPSTSSHVQIVQCSFILVVLGPPMERMLDTVHRAAHGLDKKFHFEVQGKYRDSKVKFTNLIEARGGVCVHAPARRGRRPLRHVPLVKGCTSGGGGHIS